MNAGFDLQVLAQMMRTLTRFSDEEIPLPSRMIAVAREFFGAWSEEL